MLNFGGQIMFIILFALIGFPQLHATSNEIEEARTSIRALISPMLPGNKKAMATLTKDFRVDKCQSEKINWTDVLLMRKAVTLVFDFKEGCDVSGTVMPKVFQAFPANFKLRNLKTYNRIEAMNTVQSTIESRPLMTIEMREGTLYGQAGKVKFEADYKVQINPLNRDKPLEKNLGGEIRIKEVFGKKVSIREKIFIE